MQNEYCNYRDKNQLMHGAWPNCWFNFKTPNKIPHNYHDVCVNICALACGGHVPGRSKKEQDLTYIKTYLKTYLKTYINTYIKTYVKTYIKTWIIKTYTENYVNKKILAIAMKMQYNT